jgi:RNA polymerase sigma-70 factor, ECF subfamily
LDDGAHGRSSRPGGRGKFSSPGLSPPKAGAEAARPRNSPPACIQARPGDVIQDVTLCERTPPSIAGPEVSGLLARADTAKAGRPFRLIVNGSIQQASDLALMARVASLDRAAFGQLYDRYAGLLFSVALRVLRHDKDAEDVVQEVFVQIWNKAASYDASLGQPSSWFVTMVRHRAIDRLRALRRQYEVIHEITESDTEIMDSSAWLPDVDSGERSIMVKSALQKLPAEQREAIEFAFFGGLTHEEIAARLQQPLGTIKARIRRGMLKLRDSLEARL